MTTINKNNSNEAYQVFLEEIVNLVQNHRIRAVQSVQTISNQLYWNMGALILFKQKEHGWGKSVIEQLSKDLNHNFGEGVSWSPRNLRFMRQLVEDYSNVKQAVSHLEFENVKQLVSEVPWGHNILILQKVKDIKARVFYLQTTIKNRYSRSVLLHQIEADAYSNYLLHPSQHNFAAALPEHLLEQTQESIKSVYSLDFLDINKPSIGILLVPHKDHLEVEYALRTASKPIGVALYKLRKQLPSELLGKLPSAKDFQQILILKKDD